MKSASNGGILNGSLQMLHVHVFLVAPLSTSHMAEPGTDQNKCRVAVREAANHTGTAAEQNGRSRPAAEKVFGED